MANRYKQKRRIYAYGTPITEINPSEQLSAQPLAKTSTTSILPNTLQDISLPSQELISIEGVNPMATGVVSNIGSNIIDSTTNRVDDLGVPQVSAGVEIGKSALSGASTGSTFGPVGAGIGALVGTVGELIGGIKKKKEAKAQRKQIIEQAGVEQAQEYQQRLATQPQQQYTPTFANGGYLQTPINDPIVYQNGGTHEENSLGGIPIGQNASVEEGEVRHGDYIFSNRLS
jgi:hypothetical protein